MIEFQQNTQLIPQGRLKLEWSFRYVQNLGKEVGTLGQLINQVNIWCGLTLGGDITLSEAVPFGQG